jgi:hypothetical protein
MAGSASRPPWFGTAEVADVAHRELARYLGLLPTHGETALQLNGSIELVLGTAPPELPTSLRAHIQHDGYVLFPGPNGLRLSALNPKGLLNAVYGYLRWLGVSWPAPGVELLPDTPILRWPEAPIVRTPAFPRRGIFHAVQDGAWADWCAFYARLGFNEISLHATDIAWEEAMRQSTPYGLALQWGGHGLSAFVPRTAFAAHPDYFRALQPPDFNRTRLPDSNLCTGSEGAMTLVRAGARQAAEQYAGATALHLWADDLPAGGWCYCARCMGLPPQDQAMLADNAVADGVTAADPQMRVAHLIYHDTIEPPRLVAPHPALTPLYAPRERCYAHALNDPACARNRHFAERLEAVLDYFGHQPWHLFEYYSDAILFRGMLPVLPEVIADDLRYYAALGLECAQHLLVGGVVGVLPNMHIFAQQSWDLAADPWVPLQRLAAGVPGLLAAWRLRAQASRRWTALCNWPVDRYFDYRFLLELPTPLAFDYRAELAIASEELTQAHAVLPATLPAWADTERLVLATSAGICRQMAAQVAMLHALGQELRGRDCCEKARMAFAEALTEGAAVGELFRAAGMPQAYFFALNALLETIWREKLGMEPGES